MQRLQIQRLQLQRLGVFLGLLGLARPAAATWSISAVDPETGDVGIAGATCGPFVWKIGQVVPDVGAVVSQYDTSVGSRKEMAAGLESGDTPAEALAVVTTSSYDDDLVYRQFAVVGFAGPAAVYTGAECESWNGERSGETWATVGNTLVGEAVLDAVAASFQASEGLLLEERLLAALVAGADEGGDNRCDAEDAAKSAFLLVAAPGDEKPSIDLTASGKGAVWELEDKYSDGKRTNCHCSSTRPLSGAWLLVLPLTIALARRRR